MLYPNRLEVGKEYESSLCLGCGGLVKLGNLYLMSLEGFSSESFRVEVDYRPPRRGGLNDLGSYLPLPALLACLALPGLLNCGSLAWVFISSVLCS